MYFTNHFWQDDDKLTCTVNCYVMLVAYVVYNLTTFKEKLFGTLSSFFYSVTMKSKQKSKDESSTAEDEGELLVHDLTHKSRAKKRQKKKKKYVKVESDST